MSEPLPEIPAGEPLVDYLAAHRDRYTRSALTESLRARGFAEAEIDAAWAAVDASPEPAAAAGAPLTTRQSVLSGLAILFALAALAMGMFGIVVGSGNRPAMILYGILFPIQVIVVARWIHGRIRASSGLRAGDAAVTLGWLVVPPIAMVALIYICIGYTSAFGCVLHCS